MEFEIAKEKAVKYIVMAKKTKHEVYQKLKKSGFDGNIINQVIDYLSDLNYLNDEEYIDAYLKQSMRLLKYSIFEIKQKLLQKGLDKCIIENKLEYLKDNNYEQKIIEKLLNSKLKNLDDLKKKQYLYRRGFKTNIDTYM